MVSATALKNKFGAIKQADASDKTPVLFVQCCEELAQGIEALEYTRGEGQELSGDLQDAFWLNEEVGQTVVRVTDLMWDMAEWASDEDDYPAISYKHDKEEIRRILALIIKNGWLPTTRILRAYYLGRENGRIVRSQAFTWFESKGQARPIFSERETLLSFKSDDTLEAVHAQLPKVVDGMALKGAAISIVLKEYVVNY